MIDTHSHIYSEEFDTDRDAVIHRAKKAGVRKIILPNVDSDSIPRMLALEEQYPDYCFAAIGLHPTGVKENYKEELSVVRSELERRPYIAVGEIGMDLYWDKTFLKEQIEVFQTQIEWALEYHLPIIIHQRDSFRETMNALQPFKNSDLRGVFHSFGGSVEEAREILDFGGFVMGINGIVTFKNARLAEVIRHFSLKDFVPETDAPYLTPAPYRGKRNESAYLAYVCEKLADIFNISSEELSLIMDKTAEKLFFD